MDELEEQLQRLAEHHAAQVPAFSMPPTDELAGRRRLTRRMPVEVLIAACTRVALLVGGVLLLLRSGDGPSVQTPAGKSPPTAYGGCTGKAYVNNSGDATVSVLNTATDAVSATIPVGRFPLGPFMSPDGKYVYVSNNLDGTVSAISTATDKVSATITVGKGPGGARSPPTANTPTSPKRTAPSR